MMTAFRVTLLIYIFIAFLEGMVEEKGQKTEYLYFFGIAGVLYLSSYIVQGV